MGRPRKLLPNAFDFYVELGPERSYRAVAEHFGVTKVTVVNRAKQEDWQGQLRKLEDEARAESSKKNANTMQAIHERQLKAVRLLQARAVEVLRTQPPEKGIRAANALCAACKHELLLIGEPTERQANVEEIVKREYERWMTVAEETPTRNGSHDDAEL